ncbi:BrnT family toxin [Rhodoferax sp. 4810]|uniref:BrnT family toxin n=1 Tax=Thiospirillum jenense TaxID=1653858 RepID=A0A839HF32_9GAMM|nr:BrnT family toxin [Thiospirillum jenense]MBB1073085.1 BrnT family toxin [Rhodoferax jenense]MBB1125032.1 BrnT family toxin [Thiospirillum jenense]
MDISYDPAKNARNIAERGLSFDRVAAFDFKTALFVVDNRYDYGEVRYRALGKMNGRVHALVFVENPTGIRVISFRKANKREVKYYEEATKS